MFKFVFLGMEIIEIIVALSVILFCFYLFMEFVFPWFTLGAIKPGWLFFSKWQKKKAAKKAALEAAVLEATAKADNQAPKTSPESEVKKIQPKKRRPRPHAKPIRKYEKLN